MNVPFAKITINKQPIPLWFYVNKIPGIWQMAQTPRPGFQRIHPVEAAVGLPWDPTKRKRMIFSEPTAVWICWFSFSTAVSFINIHTIINYRLMLSYMYFLISILPGQLVLFVYQHLVFNNIFQLWFFCCTNKSKTLRYRWWLKSQTTTWDVFFPYK